MAPPDVEKSREVKDDSAASHRPISTIIIIIAMQTEALPLVNTFQLTEDQNSVFPKGVPWVRYHGVYKDLKINIICPGNDAVFGVDSVGTVSASLVTYASIQALKPDLIINAGTSGGFKAKGASIGDVYLVSEVAFHDRRIPIPVFDLYGVCCKQCFSTPKLSVELNLKVGKLTTGDSLDMSPQDEASIIANGATVKDMEGAAVAYVADLLKVPTIFVKAVTDIVDGEKPTAEEFLQNLVAVSAALAQGVTNVVDYINGKFPKGVPWVTFHGVYKDLKVNIIWPGKESVLGIETDLIINASTSGGFKAKGASIADMYLVSEVAFHDTGIPIPPESEGFRSLWSLFRAMFLNPKAGRGVNLKEVPTIFVKAVTDIVDGEKPTAEEFLQTLVAVSEALDQVVTKVVDYINGKFLSKL